MEEKAPFQGLGKFCGRLIARLRVYRCAFADDGGEEAAVALGQQSLDGHAQGVDIASAVSLAVAVLLWRGIAFGAQEGSILVGIVFHQPGRVKVNEAVAARFFQQEIGGLDIPVDNAVGVEEGKA